MGSGFRTFASGETLTSSNVQNYLMDQSVMVFAGTAARGSAIASPESGMVSYRTDGTADSKREGFEFYDGASWTRLIPAATPGGLVYLTGASFTTATSFSLPDNTFSSTYRNYRILINVTALTSDADFTIRLRAGGSDATGTNYNTSLDGIVQQGTASAQTFDAGTAWLAAEQDSGLPCYSLSMDIYNPNQAVRTVANGQISFVLKNAASSPARYGGWFHNVASAYDSLSFISSVASSMTGVYRVYGYADS